MPITGTEFAMEFMRKREREIEVLPDLKKTALHWVLNHVANLNEVNATEPDFEWVVDECLGLRRSSRAAVQETDRAWICTLFSTLNGNGGFFRRHALLPKTPLDWNDHGPTAPRVEGNAPREHHCFLDATVLRIATRKDLRDYADTWGPLLSSRRVVNSAIKFRLSGGWANGFRSAAIAAGIAPPVVDQFMTDLFWVDVEWSLLEANKLWKAISPIREVISLHVPGTTVLPCQTKPPAGDCPSATFGRNSELFRKGLSLARAGLAPPSTIVPTRLLEELKGRGPLVSASVTPACTECDCCLSPGEAWFLKFEVPDEHIVPFTHLLTSEPNQYKREAAKMMLFRLPVFGLPVAVQLTTRIELRYIAP